ncbi:hypothetical protein [Streptomyces sp. NPDC020681]|uniref:hypothetical protein n=1 Tax=Streptomyces sp. NPDC020681 TaxID=3365083 RepID=UPI0037A6F8AF
MEVGSTQGLASPELNGFLITHRAVLDDEELELARGYFEGLIWMDRAAERSRLLWERERRETLQASGIDIGPYESSWTTTALPREPEGMGVADALREQRKWASPRAPSTNLCATPSRGATNDLGTCYGS